jgi:hypothetical protein
MVLTDKHGRELFNDFIFKFDATKFQTCIYTNEHITSEKNIIRLTETLRTVQAIDGLVLLNYESGAFLQITKR